VLSNPKLFPKTQFVGFKAMQKLFDQNIVSANDEEWQYVVFFFGRTLPY
jgi:hypothetical protein